MTNIVSRNPVRKVTREVTRRVARTVTGDLEPLENFLGTESGFTFLLETGDKILLEEQPNV